MTKEEMTDRIVVAKKAKGLSWEAIAGKLDKGTTRITSVCLGMSSMPESLAKSLCGILELDDDVCAALQEYPHKSWEKTIPQDPAFDRLCEIVGVYGDTINEITCVFLGMAKASDFTNRAPRMASRERPGSRRICASIRCSTRSNSGRPSDP